MNDENENVTMNLVWTFPIFLVFLALKLTNVIDWCWCWITAPLWAPVALATVIAVIAAIVVAICDLF